MSLALGRAITCFGLLHAVFITWSAVHTEEKEKSPVLSRS